MAHFETVNALRDLDQRTPDFFRGEIFAHGDLSVRMGAIEALTDMDPSEKSVRVLMEMLKLD